MRGKKILRLKLFLQRQKLSLTFFLFRDVLPGPPTFSRESAGNANEDVCGRAERRCAVRVRVRRRSALRRQPAPAVARPGPLPARPGRAQHSSSSMTSMTMVRGPVRIRLLTVR